MKTKHPLHRRRLVTSVALLASSALLLSACAGADTTKVEGDGGSLADFAPVTLSFSDIGGESTNGAPFYAFADEVAAATDDKVTFEGFFAGSLLGAADALGGIQSGTADMGYLGASGFPNEIPIAHWNNPMGSISSSTYPLMVLQGFVAQLEWSLSNPELTAELSEHDLMVIWNTLPDPRTNLICMTPVRNAEEAAGKRLGTFGTPPSLPEMEALGFTIVQLPPNEWYEGLQRGVIDCVGGTPTAAATFGLFEVAKHWTFADFNGSAGTYIAGNKSKFDSLPAEAQDAIWDALPTWLVERGKVWFDNYSALITAQDEQGVTFYDPDKSMRDTVTKIQAGAFDALADTAPATVSDPKAFLDDYRGIYDKWEERLATDLKLPTKQSGTTLEQIAEWDRDSIDWDKFRAMLAEVYDAHRPNS